MPSIWPQHILLLETTEQSSRLTFAQLVSQKKIQQSEQANEIENVSENESQYFSANSSGSGDDLIEQEASKRVVWKVERTFQNDKELQEYLKDAGCWSIRDSKEITTQGLKTRYRCNRVKRSAPQCTAALYTLHLSVPENDSSNEEENPNPNPNICIELYRTNAEHSCDNSNFKSNRISTDIQDIIINKVKEGKTATAISFEMSEMDIELENLPSVKQIRNVIQNYKNQEFGKQPLTMKQLTEFVHLYSGIPNSEDEAFVVLFERSPSHEPNQFYRFFISTPRLLRNAANVKNLHADATQKVTNEKKPLIVIGSTDITGTFHLIGITVTSHETADAYTLSFRAVKQGVSQITNSTIEPDVLVCDADPAIHIGFQRIFGPKPIIMCYSHVKGNVERKYKFNNSKENKKPLQSDLYVLHKCYDKQTFDIGCQLFIQKWKDKEPTVVHNLTKSFFEKNSNWFMGCVPRAPKTNNALERFNGTLKQLQTYYCRKPLKEFVFDALKICRQRSKHYRKDKKLFQNHLEITAEDVHKELGP